jgi:HAE1 family hydrophobic/amphiphilic exporter-1
MRKVSLNLLLIGLCATAALAQQVNAQPVPQSLPQIAKNRAEAVKKQAASAPEAPAEPSSPVTLEADVKTDTAPDYLANPMLLTRVGVDNSQTTPLSLNDAIRKALENNNDIEVAKNDVRLAETTLRAIQGAYDPVFTFSPNYDRNSTTGSSATNDFRVNSDMSHNISRGGGNYRFFYNNSRTENRFAQAQVTSGTGSSSGGAIYTTSVGFQYTQPLWRGRQTDDTRRQIKIQRKRLQQSDADFRRRTIEVISQVQRAYWDLVFALRDQQNRIANLNLSRENLRRVEAQIAAGRSAPLEKAEVNTELANRETDVLVASQQVSISENTLKQLLLKEASSPEWNVSWVPTDRPVFSTDPVSLDEALKDANVNREELRRLNFAKEINAIDVSYFKNQLKPRIDLTSTLSFDGLSSSGGQAGSTFVPQFTGNDEILRLKLNTLFVPGSQIPNPLIEVPPPAGFLTGGYTQALRNIFRTDAPNFTVGVTISFPLRNETAKANLAGAEIQKQQLDAQTRSQEQAIIAEVRNAVQAVETARQRVLAARSARENAEIQLRGEQKLYEAGRSTTFLLFQRENALANARNSEIRSETDYNKALSDLQRATSTTFRINNIEVVSPADNK